MKYGHEWKFKEIKTKNVVTYNYKNDIMNQSRGAGESG